MGSWRFSGQTRPRPICAYHVLVDGDGHDYHADPRGLSGESIGEAPSFSVPKSAETERAAGALKEIGHEIGHAASEAGSEIANGAESIINEVKGGNNAGRNPPKTRN